MSRTAQPGRRCSMAPVQPSHTEAALRAVIKTAWEPRRVGRGNQPAHLGCVRLERDCSVEGNPNFSFCFASLHGTRHVTITGAASCFFDSQRQNHFLSLVVSRRNETLQTSKAAVFIGCCECTLHPSRSSNTATKFKASTCVLHPCDWFID